MRRKKTLWLLSMAALCLVLYTIVISRMNRQVDVVFGGAEGAFVSSDSVSFADPNSMNTPEPTEDIWPDIDITLPQYTMVRDEKGSLLSSAYKPDVEQIEGTYMMFSVTAISYLEDMIQAAKDAGFTVHVAGAYRSYSYQTELFNGKATQIALGMGLSGDYLDPKYQDAVAEARTITSYPGASEHQLGLAVDLMDKSYSPLVYSNMNQDFFEWLDAHCAEYGFIKRYPTKKLLLTGWDEPWHYRYVGVEAATFIMENDLCFEEFYQHYVPDFEY